MKEEFYQILKEITTKEEFKKIPSDIYFKDINAFIDFLIAEKLFFVVDFKGESKEGDIRHFLTQRLKKFDIDIEFDDSNLKNIDTAKLEVGEFL